MISMDQGIDRLVGEVASSAGEILTDRWPGRLADQLVALGQKYAVPPDLDARGQDDILSYDDFGMWR